uniref:Uncharacterized protein n=1 Tax=Romanomermis culicivorax TaxID=13658 RepID=A0A915JWA1_ROMCU
MMRERENGKEERMERKNDNDNDFSKQSILDAKASNSIPSSEPLRPCYILPADLETGMAAKNGARCELLYIVLRTPAGADLAISTQ